MQDYYSDAYDDSYLDGPTELEEASDSLSSSSSEDIDIIYDNEVRESLLIQEPDEEEDDTYHPSKLNNRRKRVLCGGVLILLAVFLILVGVTGYLLTNWGDGWQPPIPEVPINRGLAQTPPMGWNTWNQFQCNVSETLVKEMADAMAANGLIELGYKYLIIDDCWHASKRDAQGQLQPHPEKFPSGMKSLVEYVKSKGLKLGIYTDIGKSTCAGKPGSQGHYEDDIKLFHSWGIEYVKVDYCDKTWDQTLHPASYYTNISKAIVENGNNMVFSICEWGWESPWLWAPNISHMWRTTLDIYPQWFRILQIIESNEKLTPFAGPGHWNDPDMLEVGVVGFLFNNPAFSTSWLDPVQSKSHFCFWSMLAAPLILGNDIRKMDPWVKDIITKEGVIAINQDPLGKQAQKVLESKRGATVESVCISSSCSWTQIWTKPLSGNAYAVLLFNRGHAIETNKNFWKPENITVFWEAQLGISPENYLKVTDVWSGKFLGSFKEAFQAVNVAPNDVVLLKLERPL